MTLTFTEATPTPAEFSRLFETTGWNRQYQASQDELMGALSRSQWIVAVNDGSRLVGFGRVVTDGFIHAMIYDLIVHPEYQNRGLGTRILDALVQKCLDANIRDIQLFCARGQRAFYEKRGFVARPDDAPGMQYKRS
jgi:GNAT superfamily N-acetyltransferase